MYVFSNELADRGVKKMEKKNIFIGKDGAKVGVKEVRTEDYEDRTQKYVCYNPLQSPISLSQDDGSGKYWAGLI